jgi:hypothetical protein
VNAAMEVGCAVITNLDEHSPVGLTHMHSTPNGAERPSLLSASEEENDFGSRGGGDSGRGVKPRSEATSPGQPGRRAEGHASVHRAAGLPEATGSGASGPKPRGHPNCTRGRRAGRRHRRGHGKPGQRERRQGRGPGNRTRVQLRRRRSGNRPDRAGVAPSPGNRRWRRAATSRATGSRAKTGIARRASGHDGRCVGRAKANARRSTSGGSSHLSGSPG